MGNLEADLAAAPLTDGPWGEAEVIAMPQAKIAKIPIIVLCFIHFTSGMLDYTLLLLMVVLALAVAYYTATEQSELGPFQK